MLERENKKQSINVVGISVDNETSHMWKLHPLLLYKNYQGGEIKANEKSGECSAKGSNDKTTSTLHQKPQLYSYIAILHSHFSKFSNESQLCVTRNAKSMKLVHQNTANHFYVFQCDEQNHAHTECSHETFTNFNMSSFQIGSHNLIKFFAYDKENQEFFYLLLLIILQYFINHF